MRKVSVTAYNPQWPKLFENKVQSIQGIFHEQLLEIHHIGSTAVPGLKAKPIIDMLAVVHDIREVDFLNEQMRLLRYEPMGEYGIPGRRFFQKGGDERTHHLHVFSDGSPEIVRHLAVRDYLRVHPRERERYGDLKEVLARQAPADIEAYINGKNAFVKALEDTAVEWHRQIASRDTQKRQGTSRLRWTALGIEDLV